jgi:hypothetical protein
VADGPTLYDSESLFEYLNGGAPLYLDYGFESLTQIRYQMGEDPFASVTLDVYDMGSALGAFGVYRSAVPPGFDAGDWGVEGFRSGTVAAGWQGGIYVHGEADDERPDLVEVLEWAVRSALEGAGGPETLPRELAVLPVEGRIRGSERYVAADLFGHSFLPGGVVARYVSDSGDVELFFSGLPDGAEADEALRRLRSHQVEWGTVGTEITGLGDGGFRFSDPALGPGMVVRSGTFIVGAHGSGEAEKYVRELLESLPGN